MIPIVPNIDFWIQACIRHASDNDNSESQCEGALANICISNSWDPTFIALRNSDFRKVQFYCVPNLNSREENEPFLSFLIIFIVSKSPPHYITIISLFIFTHTQTASSCRHSPGYSISYYCTTSDRSIPMWISISITTLSLVNSCRSEDSFQFLIRIQKFRFDL